MAGQQVIVGSVAAVRNLHVIGEITTTGDVASESDIRVKTDIQTIENGLDKVLTLSGYTFKKKNSDVRHTGVIAQEVQSVLPEAVSSDAEGTLRVAYGNMVGLLIEAIKEQQSQIEALKEQLIQLQDKS
jgi:hypothetical protein